MICTNRMTQQIHSTAQRVTQRAFHTGLPAVGFVLASLSAQAQFVTLTNAPIKMPQGAFLRRPAPDVVNLVKQVKSDPTVAVRYARLFHLPIKQIPLAFEQLRLKPLTSDHVMEVHYVKAGEKKEGEKLVFKPRRVKKGTQVYCLPDGTPLLVRVCGNPIRTRVSAAMYIAGSIPDFKASETLIPRPVVASSTSLHIPVERSVLSPVPQSPVIPVEEAANVLPVIALPTVPPHLPLSALKITALPPVYHWVRREKGLWGVAPLALVPLLKFGFTDPVLPPLTLGGNPLVPPGNTTPLNTPQTTPEPGTITLAAAFTLSAGFLFARKRRSQAE